MPTRTVTIYQVPNTYASGGGTVTVQNVFTLTISDDDGFLNATPGSDPGTPQVLTSNAGTISSYNFLYNDNIRWRVNSSSSWNNETVKTFQMVVNGVTRTFIMNDTGTSIPGLQAGYTVNLVSYTTYTSLGYSAIPCFVAGTLIRTDLGERPVEALRPGDLVDTLDSGPQPLRWAGSVTLGRSDLLAAPHLAPVAISAGSLGHGLPETDLLVSPQHRVLLSGWRVELAFGEEQVLAAAKHLVGWPGVRALRMPREVTYHHLLFDRHEIVFANGQPAESFLLGEAIRDSLDSRLLAEIAALMPDAVGALRTPARRIARAHEVVALTPQAA